MSIFIDAIYEDGVLKPAQPVKLQEHQRVRIVIQEWPTFASQMYGHIGWTGDAETVRRIANEPEFGVHEAS